MDDAAVSVYGSAKPLNYVVERATLHWHVAWSVTSTAAYALLQLSYADELTRTFIIHPPSTSSSLLLTSSCVTVVYNYFRKKSLALKWISQVHGLNC